MIKVRPSASKALNTTFKLCQMRAACTAAALMGSRADGSHIKVVTSRVRLRCCRCTALEAVHKESKCGRALPHVHHVFELAWCVSGRSVTSTCSTTRKWNV